jgi:hypothetical protein
MNDFDIFCVTETDLNVTDVISLQNYEFISKRREQSSLRKSGEIGVFVHNNISRYTEILDIDCEYIL